MNDNMSDTSVSTLLKYLENVALWYDEAEVIKTRKGPLRYFCRWATRHQPPALTISSMSALLIKHGMNDFKIKVLIANAKNLKDANGLKVKVLIPEGRGLSD
jgi:hypothetical protein